MRYGRDAHIVEGNHGKDADAAPRGRRIVDNPDSAAPLGERVRKDTDEHGRTQTDMDSDGNFRQRMRYGLFAAGCAFLGHFAGIFNGFTNWDDNSYITENPLIQNFTLENIHKIFFTFQISNYHPLTLLSFQLEHLLWGNDAWGYHLVNVMLHSLNAGLVFLFLSGILKRRLGLCLWGALVFALHPLRVEAVAWISQRKEVLCVLFYLGALLCYRGWRKGPSIPRYLYMVGLGVLSLVSKPTAVSLPMILLLDAWLEDRRFRIRRIVEILPILVAAVGVGILTILAQRSSGALNVGRSTAPVHGLIVSSQSLFFYLWKTFWPSGLCAYYPEKAGLVSLNVWTGLPIVGALGLTGAALAFSRRIPLVGYGWMFFLVALAPMIGIVRVGSAFAADRYTYLPSIGLSVVLVGLLAVRLDSIGTWESHPERKRILPVGGILVLCVLTVLTIFQTGIWYDSISLWIRTSEYYPGVEMVEENLAEAFLGGGNFKKAEETAGKVVEKNPTRVRAMLIQGSAMILQGRGQEAREVFLRATRTETPLVGQRLEAMYKLAMTESELGMNREAEEHFRRACEIDPKDARPRRALETMKKKAGEGR